MKKILAIAALTVMSMAAWAVPADRRPHPYVQPNGDTLMVRLNGDERFHFTSTTDGHLIKQDEDGCYYYATWHYVSDADGNTWRTAVLTKVVAKNAGERSEKEEEWLEKLEKEEEKNLAKENKRLERKREIAAKKAERAAKKAAKKAEKQAVKDAKKAEKQAIKDAKKAEKQAEKEAKKTAK